MRRALCEIIQTGTGSGRIAARLTETDLSLVGIDVIFGATTLKLMLRIPRRFGTAVFLFAIDKVYHAVRDISATVG